MYLTIPVPALASGFGGTRTCRKSVDTVFLGYNDQAKNYVDDEFEYNCNGLPTMPERLVQMQRVFKSKRS